MQSSFALGYAFAALVAGIMLRFANWRTVFFVGILPAAITFWIQKSVPESRMWEEHRDSASRVTTEGFAQIFRRPYLKKTLALLLVTSRVAADGPDARGMEFFESKIRPILVEHCYKCHSAQAKQRTRYSSSEI